MSLSVNQNPTITIVPSGKPAPKPSAPEQAIPSAEKAEKKQNLAFGRQVVPLIRSEKPITKEEKEDLKAIQQALNESLGQNAVVFEIKNKTNVDAIVNHKNNKAEQAIADNLREIAKELSDPPSPKEQQEKTPVYPNNPLNAPAVNYSAPPVGYASTVANTPKVVTNA